VFFLLVGMGAVRSGGLTVIARCIARKRNFSIAIVTSPFLFAGKVVLQLQCAIERLSRRLIHYCHSANQKVLKCDPACFYD